MHLEDRLMEIFYLNEETILMSWTRSVIRDLSVVWKIYIRIDYRSFRIGIWACWRRFFFSICIHAQSIVGTELFPFNSRSVHIHERNFGHFFKGNLVMNVNGTSVTFSQWTERKSLFIFSVRAEQSSMNSALPHPLS